MNERDIQRRRKKTKNDIRGVFFCQRKTVLLIYICTCRTIKLVMKQRFLRSSLIYNVTKSCSRWNNMNIGGRIEKKGRKNTGGWYSRWRRRRRWWWWWWWNRIDRSHWQSPQCDWWWSSSSSSMQRRCRRTKMILSMMILLLLLSLICHRHVEYCVIMRCISIPSCVFFSMIIDSIFLYRRWLFIE